MKKNVNLQEHVRNKGFTLIELLVVIAIIGLLASVVLGNLQDSRTSAQESTIIQQARQMSNLVELVYNETGSYADAHRGYLLGCSEFDSGNYQTDLQKACQQILDSGGLLFSGAASADTFNNGRPETCLPTSTECGYTADYSKHSILVSLPSGTNEYYCVG